MTNISEVMSHLPLFQNIPMETLVKMSECFQIRVRKYQKEESVFSEGDQARQFYVVLSGQILLYKDDALGNRNIIGKVKEGSLLGEAYAISGNMIYPFHALTMEDSILLLMNSSSILHPCQHSCTGHVEFYRNFIFLLANRNRQLTEKITITSQKTTRDKILSFLCHASRHGTKHKITIDYNRQELADYLGVERTAMCAELSKMQREHLIIYHKNQFEICPKALSSQTCFNSEEL